MEIIKSKVRSLVGQRDYNIGDEIISAEVPVSDVGFALPTSLLGIQSFTHFQPHEVQLITQMGVQKNIQPIAPAILAARCLAASKTSTTVAEQLNSLCNSPKVSWMSQRDQEKHDMSSKLCAYLLSSVNVVEDIQACGDILHKLSCNIFTIVDGNKSPIGKFVVHLFHA